MSGCVQSDKGCVREVNEDNGRYIFPENKKLLAKKGILAVVADGMGGHLGGERASSLAVDIISRVYYESNRNIKAALKKAFTEANRVIHHSSISDENLNGMGTTCTALVLQNSQALLAYIGDSRLYLIREGEIYLLSEDHSAVMEMAKRGIISREEASRHSDRNIIQRALGVYPKAEFSIWEQPMPAQTGDQFILCSDGLYDLVEEEEIKHIVMTVDAQSACQKLIGMAKSRGGYDNITVCVINLKAESKSEPQNLRETRVLKISS